MLREVNGVSEPSQCDLLCAAQSECTSWTFRAGERLCLLLHSDAHTKKRVIQSAAGRSAETRTETVITALFGARPCVDASTGSVYKETEVDVNDIPRSGTSREFTAHPAHTSNETRYETTAQATRSTEIQQAGQEVPRQDQESSKDDSPLLQTPSDVKELPRSSSLSAEETDARADGREVGPDGGFFSEDESAKPSFDSTVTSAPSSESALVPDQKHTEAASPNTGASQREERSGQTPALQAPAGPVLIASTQPPSSGRLPPCARAGVSYEGHDLQPVSTASLLGSARECWSLCLDVPLCYYWTFDSTSGRCLLKDANAPMNILRARPASFVSGPRSCPYSADPRYFLLLNRRPLTAPDDDLQTRPLVPLKLGSSFAARAGPAGLLGMSGAAARDDDNGEKFMATERLAAAADGGDSTPNSSYGFWSGFPPGLLGGWGWAGEKDNNADLRSFLSSWLPLGGYRSNTGDGFLARGERLGGGKNLADEEQDTRTKRTEGHIGTSVVSSDTSQGTFPGGVTSPVSRVEGRPTDESARVSGRGEKAADDETRESSWLCQHEGVELVGGDLLLVGGHPDKAGSQGMVSESPQKCAGYCADSLGCMFWSFDRLNKLCYLKSWIAIQSYKSDESTRHFVSGPVTVTPDCFGPTLPPDPAGRNH